MPRSDKEISRPDLEHRVTINPDESKSALERTDAKKLGQPRINVQLKKKTRLVLLPALIGFTASQI